MDNQSARLIAKKLQELFLLYLECYVWSFQC